MKTARQIVLITACAFLLTSGTSCKLWNSVFGQKSGCPSNGKNVGAERVLSGEKVPKAKKFRS